MTTNGTLEPIDYVILADYLHEVGCPIFTPADTIKYIQSTKYIEEKSNDDIQDRT